jgi:hypothetical protein
MAPTILQQARGNQCLRCLRGVVVSTTFEAFRPSISSATLCRSSCRLGRRAPAPDEWVVVWAVLLVRGTINAICIIISFWTMMRKQKMVVGHALEPLPYATLEAGMPRGMVNGEEVRRRCRRIRGQRERYSSGTIRDLGVPLRHATLIGALVAQHGWYTPARDTGMVVRVGRSDRR